jgi:hypothetical protein
MQTRSQTRKYNEIKFVFDFEESSRAWRANKKSIGNGMYVYKIKK